MAGNFCGLQSGIAPSCSDSGFNKPSKNQSTVAVDNRPVSPIIHAVAAILHNPADGLRPNLKSNDKFFQLH